MALFEGKTPAERNKTIAALAFGLIALILLGRMFFGSSGSGTTTTTNANRRQAARNASTAPGAAQQDDRIDTAPRPVVYERVVYDGGDAGRNIFAFFARPQSTSVALPAISPTPPPTPTPPPPLLLASLAPPNVYAQTGEFALKLSGDKFTAAVRVYVDNQEVPTRYDGAQQLTATVPSSLITAPGNRQITVRTPDGVLYSNQASLNVMQPPVPTYTYIGFISRPRTSETAVLKDQKNDLLSVQKNDVVGGRFQVMGITARSVELQDKDLKIKHTLPYIAGVPGGPIPRGAVPPPPPPSDDGGDEEP
ncbi:MAG TPA: hypothetical protein VF240_14405 [Pyrinomonadaceae bacterium]